MRESRDVLMRFGVVRLDQQGFLELGKRLVVLLPVIVLFSNLDDPISYRRLFLPALGTVRDS
jgi:hypothetical protein